jgi:hypothetical protein
MTGSQNVKDPNLVLDMEPADFERLNLLTLAFDSDYLAGQ